MQRPLRRSGEFGFRYSRIYNCSHLCSPRTFLEWQPEREPPHKSNVYVDISGWKAKYLPASFLREAKGRLRNQVCFGSDYPMFDPQEHLSDVQSLDLGAEVNDGLMRRNARRFLGLPDGDDAEAGGLSRSPRE
jgi:predicted TIM-barrel fold metal-dependent hydrolase